MLVRLLVLTNFPIKAHCSFFFMKEKMTLKQRSYRKT
jgi:hypothetical protein